MYIYSGNSLRAVEKSMEVFGFVFPFLGLKAPSYVTVRDRVLKAGLDTYAHRCKNLPVDEQYVSLTKAIGNARHYALTDVDYLMPCNMRALARYMNVFGWIHWAKNIMEASDKLSPKERKMYSCGWERGSLVE